MLSLRDEGITVLLSSHQLSEVETVCDDVTILVGGRVAAEGDLDRLLSIEGRSSVKVRGFDSGLPETVQQHAENVAVSGGLWVFSTRDGDVRRVVDAVDDSGGVLVSVAPLRDSLEDYFSRLIDLGARGESAS
jgi:ABC-2 type transport system ATP-binding protein